jgi:hypothetical protein
MSTPNPLKILCFFSFCLCYLLSTIFLPFILFLSCPLHSTTVLLYLIVIFLALSQNLWKKCYRLRSVSVDAFAQLRKATITFVMSVSLSVCPRGKTRFLLNGFSLNLMLQYLSKICRENIHFVKISQEQLVLHMKTYVHL